MVGTSGSGKTRLAGAIAERLGVPCLELDSIFHLPNWTPLETGEFLRRIGEVTASDAWVVDGNYRVANEQIWPRADTVVWLDLPRRTVMRQLALRSARRVLTRQRLWNGNRERLRNLLSRDPARNILLWAWQRHDLYRQRYGAAMVDASLAHLTFVRLRTHAEAAAWLAQLEEAAASPDR